MSPNKIISCLSMTIALLVLTEFRTSAQFVFGNAEPTEINQLSTPQRLVIPALAPSEIVPAAKTSESVANEEDLLTPPRFNTVIIRELPALWQMRVPVEQVGLLYATYEIRGENGRRNAVSNEQRSDSAAQVLLEPLPIIEISRDQNTNTALIQGGVRLKIDISSTEFAGAYAGDVTVTLNQR
ncbi:hypothetical protein [Nostoc sp. FACHB-133]|uniref:hypothetical protein n=1 Tax=Nostoc sp. FACHB-133 TaxID=2692835 RepID=UPI0016848F61|nr:hypothetical protein [Nostoc sp. FACHB-133]MBD2523585.1 hypothetical protein [Nostoc sp. FACHB-133]